MLLNFSISCSVLFFDHYDSCGHPFPLLIKYRRDIQFGERPIVVRRIACTCLIILFFLVSTNNRDNIVKRAGT